MIATASAADYRRVIEVLAARDACDAIITIFVPPLVTEARDVTEQIGLASQRTSGVTLASVSMGNASTSASASASESRARVPTFDFPEYAARAVAHAARYGRWRRRPPGSVPSLVDVRSDEASAIIAAAAPDQAGWLGARDVAALLRCYGLPLIPTRIVDGAGQAESAAAEFGGAVALKAIAPGLLHKTDAGGVVLGLRGPAAVRRGVRQIEAAVAERGRQLDGLLVQPMAEPGVELLVGVVHDESFGPVIACGAGGSSTELLKDVAVRITPLSELDAKEMVRSLRTFPLLDGYRGTAPCDLDAIEDVLLRLSALVDAHPEIAELDLNPLIARADGARILDARVRVQAPPPRRPPFAL
jgi:acyl-CoA synthetase (NDP forming)